MELGTLRVRKYLDYQVGTFTQVVLVKILRFHVYNTGKFTPGTERQG